MSTSSHWRRTYSVFLKTLSRSLGFHYQCRRRLSERGSWRLSKPTRKIFQVRLTSEVQNSLCIHSWPFRAFDPGARLKEVRSIIPFRVKARRWRSPQVYLLKRAAICISRRKQFTVRLSLRRSEFFCSNRYKDRSWQSAASDVPERQEYLSNFPASKMAFGPGGIEGRTTAGRS